MCFMHGRVKLVTVFPLSRDVSTAPVPEHLCKWSGIGGGRGLGPFHAEVDA